MTLQQNFSGKPEWLLQAKIERARQRSTGNALIYPDPATFLLAEMYIPETPGIAMTLHPEQDAVLRAMARRGADGNLAYSTWLYSSVKKSAKTTIGAAVALWQAWRIPDGEIYIVGNDLKQADNRMNKAIRYCIEHNPQMRDRCRVIRNTVYLDNGTVIEAVPVDARGEAGSNPTGIFWTEVWGAKQAKHEEMWSEMTLSPTRAGQSFKFLESYAGHRGESLILERLYDDLVTPENVLDPAISPELYASGKSVAYWNTRRYLPWQVDNDDYYAQERREKTPTEYRRQHHNEWQNALSVFVDPLWWTACEGELPPHTDRSLYVMALDAAVSGDCFALVLVGRDGETVYPREARIWTPPEGGEIQFADVERTVRLLCQQYRVVEIAYDPYQLKDMAQRLTAEGYYLREFGQGAARLEADKQLHDLIRDGRIRHDGHDGLTRHVTNAARLDSDDKLRIVKRSDALKIDAAVALSMATDRALRLNLG